MVKSIDRVYFIDLWDSTKTYLALDVLAPFVVYAVALGIVSGIGDLLVTLLQIGLGLLGLFLILVIFGAVMEYFETFLGFGILLVGAVLIGGALVVGLRQLFGGMVDTLLNLLGGLMALILLLVFLAIVLLFMAACAAPCYLLFELYRDFYDSFTLRSPIAWVIPPLLMLVFVLSWATITGFMTHELMILFTLSGASLALRTTMFLDLTLSSSDLPYEEVPQIAAAGPWGIAIPAALTALLNPGVLRDIEPFFWTVFDIVTAVTPFRTPGTEAPLAAVLPAVFVSGVLLAVSEIDVGILKTSRSRSGSSTKRSSYNPSSNGSSDNGTSDSSTSSTRPSSGSTQSSSSTTSGDTEIWDGDSSGSDTQVYDPDN